MKIVYGFAWNAKTFILNKNNNKYVIFVEVSYLNLWQTTAILIVCLQQSYWMFQGLIGPQGEQGEPGARVSLLLLLLIAILSDFLDNIEMLHMT